MNGTTSPMIISVGVTVVFFLVLLPLSCVEIRLSDEALIFSCIILLMGPTWWLVSIWIAKNDPVDGDLVLVAHFAAMVSFLPPAVTLSLYVFLVIFFDSSVLNLQSTMALVLTLAIYGQWHYIYELMKIIGSSTNAELPSQGKKKKDRKRGRSDVVTSGGRGDADY